MTGTTKMRVYEIAREVGLPNKELISKIRALGLEVNNHMSALEPEDVARVKRSLEKERLANTETARLSSTVLRRRSNGTASAAITVPPGTTVHFRYLGENGNWFDDPDADAITEQGSLVSI